MSSLFDGSSTRVVGNCNAQEGSSGERAPRPVAVAHRHAKPSVFASARAGCGGGKQCNSGYDQCYNKLLNAGYCKPDYDKCMSLPASDGPIADYDSKPASKDALCAGLDPSACGTKFADLQNVYCQKKVMKCLEKSCGVPCP
jgi:hypothetical protein